MVHAGKTELQVTTLCSESTYHLISALYTTSVLQFLPHPQVKQESERIKQN